jgi:cobalt-zinc-cadmium efflux system outer membrane protein
LKPIPDLRAGIAWRHFSDTKDDAVRLGLSMPIPLWDQNRGNITEASELRAKVEAELAIARNTLTLMLGRAYATLTSSAREVQVLRASAIPNIKQAVEAVEAGYEQGRFTLLELLDIQSSATQAAIRELEALLNFHISLATIEGLTGAGYRLNAQKSQ